VAPFVNAGVSELASTRGAHVHVMASVVRSVNKVNSKCNRKLYYRQSRHMKHKWSVSNG